ncbi:MAG: hypothetical protein ACO388_09215 [Saprospiraceae bacterium]
MCIFRLNCTRVSMENPSKTNKNPFIGLRPYQIKEKDVFFGRERQVYDLLTLLQSNRIIALLGPSGSGKTSLINAGLIPEIISGQNGLVGKDWVYSIFRPGSNPIANFSLAIAKNNLLNPSIQAPADEALKLENELRVSNKSFTNYFKDSEIAQKKNFLIVVDQFEDIFKYPPELDNDINLFIDNLLRIDHEPNLGVYVIFSLRSEFLGNLFPFRRLQEYLNEFQYSIPRLRRADIEEILNKSSKISSFTFDKNTIDYLHKGLGNDPRNTAHLQYLLFNAVSKTQNGSLTESAFENIGGFSKCFAQDLNAKYEQKSDTDKIIIEKLIKNISFTDELGASKRPKKFKELENLCECEPNQLLSAIAFFNNHEHQFLSQIPPLISDNSSSKNTSLYNDDFVDISYPEFFKAWGLFHAWTEIERESKEMYLRLVAEAQRFNTGAAGLLKPPELNIFQKWYETQKPSGIWANQYHPNFQGAVDFLNKSIRAFEDEVKAKELAQKLKIAAVNKRLVMIASFSLLFIIIVSGFYINANLAKKEAEKQREIAKMAQATSLKQMNIAKEAEKKANEERELAIKAKEYADSEKEKALQAKLEEEKAKTNLVKSLEQEKAAKSLAEQKQKEAEKANKAAEVAKIEEEQAKKLAQTRENLANIQNELFVLENELRVANADEALIEKIITTFEFYKTYCYALFGKLKPNNQLQKLLFDLDQDIQFYKNAPPILSISSAGLRALSTWDNSIAFGGDDGYVYLVKNDFVEKINLQKRVRALTFNEHESSLIAGTFDGSLFLIQPDAKTYQLLYQPDNISNPVKSIIMGRDGEFITLAGKSINLFSGPETIPNTMEFEEKLNGGIWLNALGKFLIAADNALYLVSNGKWAQISPAEMVFESPISALAIYADLIALGFKNGKIKVYQPSSISNGFNLEQPIIEFIDHQTEITRLQFSKNGVLYSSGLDKKIHAYNIELSSGENAESYLVKFEAGKNWIWDIAVSENDEVLAVDESGQLFFWVNNPNLQIQKLSRYLNQHFNSR